MTFNNLFSRCQTGKQVRPIVPHACRECMAANLILRTHKCVLILINPMTNTHGVAS